MCVHILLHDVRTIHITNSKVNPKLKC